MSTIASVITSYSGAVAGASSGSISSVVVPPFHTLVAMSYAADGGGDFTGEAVTIDGNAMTNAVANALVSSIYVGCKYYVNNTASEISGTLAWSWDGALSRAGLVAAVCQNVRRDDPLDHNTENYDLNDDSPSHSITPNEANVLLLGAVGASVSGSATTWTGDWWELEYAALSGSYEITLFAKMMPSIAAASMSGTVAGSPGSKDTAFCLTSWNSEQAAARLIDGGLVR